ncbi:long-chain fatty acid--CoA ligase [Candidatus Poribacteria bacterium]|nr:long-chain fatty acid--CoA ligase [Candidatus Poribacteria bacterium]
MIVRTLLERLEQYSESTAIIHNDTVLSYRDLSDLINKWLTKLNEEKIGPGAVTALIGDYSPDSIALIIASILNKQIIVPLTPLAETHFSEYLDLSRTQHVLDLRKGVCAFSMRDAEPRQNTILRELIEKERPGLILFTSGSSGHPKAVAHDFIKLLSKYQNAHKKYRTLCFLMFDHVAGIDTYFYSLYSGGMAVLPSSRNPADICSLIEKHKVEVLPTSPTFLNLLLLSEEYKKYDLSSLKIVTFGSERMPKAVLERLRRIFRDVRIIQKYGVTELGSPASKSGETDSTWIRIDGAHFKTRIVNGVLHVKTDTAMLGYLNAESPFTEDGWFNTGDSVEVDGDYIRILGRESEIINVGGEKVHPTEVENVIYEMENISEVVVYGEKNSIMGSIVCAKVSLLAEEEPDRFAIRLKQYCREKLPRYKVPVRVFVVNGALHTDRFKKRRQQE